MAETFNITLNMDKTKRQPATIAARVGDVDSIIVNATIMNGSSAYTPSGTSAYFECVCPNGYSVRQQAQLSSNVVTVTLAPEVFQESGVINDAYFRFETGSSDNPSYVESTESFVILVYSSIDDNVEAGDYIAEWRQSQATLEEAADEAASALPTIQAAVGSVTSASTSAIQSINQAKQDVQDAAADVMTPINAAINDMNDTMTEAINEFKTDGQDEISAFDTNAANKIQQFETNASNKLTAYDNDVDNFIDTAQQQVNQNVTQLQDATQNALDAMDSALSADPYGDLLYRISRDWKLTLQDMVVLSGTIDLDLVSVGTFALDPGQVSISNAPVSGSKPFILFSGQYFKTMKYQLIVYPDESTPLYIRYNQGTASGDSVTWGSWSTWNAVSGGGSSIETPVSIANGGTGATTASQARENLGVQPGVVAGTSGRLSQSGVDLEQVILSNLFGGNSYQFLATTTSSAGVSVTAGNSSLASSAAIQAIPPSTVSEGGTTSRVIVQEGTNSMASASMETRHYAGDAPLPAFKLVRSNGTYNASVEVGINDNSKSYVGTSQAPVDDIYADNITLDTPLPISSGGTGATSADQARANIGAGTSNFSGSYNDLSDKPMIPTVPDFPLTLANGGTGAATASAARTNLDVYSKSEVDAKVSSGGGGTSFTNLVSIYDKQDLNFIFPNVSQYSPIVYYNSQFPFSGFVMNGTYVIEDNCVIMSLGIIRKSISNPGYPYLYLNSSTMDNTSSTATFDSTHGFNFFFNAPDGKVSSAHSFPFCPNGRDFWNCGILIGRISNSTPTTTFPAMTAQQVMIPFSLRFQADGWCKMLLSVPANTYINKYISIDYFIVPPINLGVGGSELS